MQRYRHELNLALYCVYLKLKKKNRKRKINEFFARRLQEGAYTMSVEKYFDNSESAFRQYFRLSRSEFDYVLSHINIDLEPQKTNFNQNPISARQKLCITLRYGNIRILSCLNDSNIYSKPFCTVDIWQQAKICDR